MSLYPLMLSAYYLVEEAEPCDTHKLALHKHVWATWPTKGQKCSTWEASK